MGQLPWFGRCGSVAVGRSLRSLWVCHFGSVTAPWIVVRCGLVAGGLMGGRCGSTTFCQLLWVDRCVLVDDRYVEDLRKFCRKAPVASGRELTG